MSAHPARTTRRRPRCQGTRKLVDDCRYGWLCMVLGDHDRGERSCIANYLVVVSAYNLAGRQLLLAQSQQATIGIPSPSVILFSYHVTARPCVHANVNCMCAIYRASHQTTSKVQAQPFATARHEAGPCPSPTQYHRVKVLVMFEKAPVQLLGKKHRSLAFARDHTVIYMTPGPAFRNIL